MGHKCPNCGGMMRAPGKLEAEVERLWGHLRVVSEMAAKAEGGKHEHER